MNPIKRRATLVEILNSKDKEKILKAAIDKRTLTFMGRSIRLTADLLTETWQTRKGRQDIFRALNEKHLQPRILYPARLSFRIEREKKSFQDRQKLKEYVTTNPALQEILRGTLLKKEEAQRNNSQKQGLNRYYDDTKFISFNSNSERERA